MDGADTPGGMVTHRTGEPSVVYRTATGNTYRYTAPGPIAASYAGPSYVPEPDYPAPATYLSTGSPTQPSPPPAYLDAIFGGTNNWFNWRVTAIRGCQAVVFGSPPRVWMASGNCWPTYPVPPGPSQVTSP